jgi:hypothetical protein
MKSFLGAMTACFVLCGAVATGQSFAPFVIPGEANPASLIADSLAPIPVDDERITVEGSYFMHEGERIRVWGVNTSFGANFPEHAEAERLAKRLAAAGINNVRLHHADTNRWSRGFWHPSTGATVYPQALERMDYFIDQLAQQGIWVNLNLHVGHEHSDYLDLPNPNSGYDKVVGIFTPALVTAQKGFADTMLNHVNQYRGVRYADDPAIAFVEITNEDSFFMWDGDSRLRNMPAYYTDILEGQYNDWLIARYTTQSALAAAWAEGVTPLGADRVINGDFQDVNEENFPDDWYLEQHGDSTATASTTRYASKDCLRIVVTNDDGTGWHLQFNQAGHTVEEGKYYTLTCDAAAATARPLGVSIMQAHDPYQEAGLSRSVNLTTSWQTYRLGFTANKSDTNVRMNFSIGGNSATVYLANVKFQEGGQDGLLAGENLTERNLAFYIDRPSRPREMDRLRFLTDTEKSYFDDMYGYIKGTLGCSALVTGTIVFGPLGLYAQQDMDFIDAHSYWKHPSFPGNPWDPNNWIVQQVAMTDLPSQSTLHGLALQRLAGKPFTVSEYNHPAPNDYQAETVPMIAAYGAAQDWDGIWIYSYGHSADLWEDEHFKSFFDIANNPAKMGYMRGGAAIFRDTGIGGLGSKKVVNLNSGGDALSSIVSLRMTNGDNLYNIAAGQGMSWEDLLESQVAVSFESASETTNASNTALEWNVVEEQGVFSAEGAKAWAYTGRAGLMSTTTNGRLTVASPGFVAVTVTALDGRALDRSATVLIAASGRSENVNMGFSANRDTVGTAWGEAPARVETVNGTLQLPAGTWTCQRLGPDGTATGDVALTYVGEQGTLSMSSTHNTMWYLLKNQDNLTQYHSADTDEDHSIALTELTRVIQLFSAGSYFCENGTEDGFSVTGSDRSCQPAHDSDYSPQDWTISLSELLRVTQLYSAGTYHIDCASEDGLNIGEGSTEHCG